MAIIDIPIVGQSYHLKDWSIDCQRTLNLYPQVVESGNAPQVSALLPTPGLKKKYELSGRVRGMYALTDRLLVVAGQKLYSISKSDQIEEIGEVAGVNTVYFADNSIQVMIVSNKAYSFNLRTNTLSTMSGSEFFGASDVAFLDSRFIWTVPNTGRFQWSGLLNTDTTALSYATAESKSDNLVRSIVNNGNLWLIGEKTTEIWAPTGSSEQPFQRMSGALLPIGCIAKNSISTMGPSLVWLSQSEHGQGQIVMTQGYQVQRISNHAIETEIAGYEQISNAYGFAYQENGHAFYLISFPSERQTLCYDLATQMWHERSYFNLETYKHEHHRALSYCFFNGMQLVGDRVDGRIYAMSTESNTDDGALIMRERVTPVINPHTQRIIFDELELSVQAGQIDNTKPQIMLDWSDDGGRTWSSTRQVDLGGVGEFTKRILFRRLGQSFKRVFRLRMTDAGRLVLLGAKARVR